jgi:hypothetical protein
MPPNDRFPCRARAVNQYDKIGQAYLLTCG